MSGHASVALLDGPYNLSAIEANYDSLLALMFDHLDLMGNFFAWLLAVYEGMPGTFQKLVTPGELILFLHFNQDIVGLKFSQKSLRLIAEQLRY